MNLREELDRAGPVVDRVNAAIRDNPLAAGLIGAGVAWMLMGGPKGFNVMAGAAGRAGSAATTAGSALASGVAKAAAATTAGLKSATSDAAGSVASLVPEISVPDADKAFEAVADAAAAVGGQINSAAAAGREYSAVIQSWLSESFKKEPLLLGAIGLALGAGIASTFATTKVENDLMGEQGMAAREKLQGLREAVVNRAQQVVSEVNNEADKQSLTHDAALGAATEIGNKVKAAVSAGRDSIAQSLRPN